MKNPQLPVPVLISLVFILMTACMPNQDAGSLLYPASASHDVVYKSIPPYTFELRKKSVDSTGDATFVFRIRNDEQVSPLKQDAGSLEGFQERLYYYSFDVQKDLYLICENTDTVYCALHYFERTYDLAPYIDLVTIFPIGQRNDQEYTFLYKDRVLGVGPVKITFNLKES